MRYHLEAMLAKLIRRFFPAFPFGWRPRACLARISWWYSVCVGAILLTGLSKSQRRGIVARAVWNGAVLADSEAFIVVESGYFFPPGDVHFEYLREDPAYHTECPWKGSASYYDVVVDGQTNRHAAWYYPHPGEKAKHMAGYITFCKGIHIEH
jgi:uncharacterized protein (DUF427 family)